MSSGFEERYAAALQERGLEDVRPLYRELLVRLRKKDESAYEEGVRRYDDHVEPALEEGDDALGPWLRYGAWLARRLTPGQLTAVGPDGAASEVELDPHSGDTASAGPGAEPEGEGGAAAAGQADGRAGAGGDAGDGDADGGGESTAKGRGAGRGGVGSGGRLDSVPPGCLLLHLPEDDGEPAIALAVPAEPTVHQEATREILCG